jgi:hypothetical protein
LRNDCEHDRRGTINQLQTTSKEKSSTVAGVDQTIAAWCKPSNLDDLVEPPTTAGSGSGTTSGLELWEPVRRERSARCLTASYLAGCLPGMPSG